MLAKINVVSKIVKKKYIFCPYQPSETEKSHLANSY